MNSLLITQLNYVQSPKSKMKSPIVKKKEIIKSKNDKFLDFLIDEKSYLADFDKIEEHYVKTLRHNYRVHNNNKVQLQKKKEEYDLLLTHIQGQLEEHQYITDLDLDEQYCQWITEKNEAIRLKEHELECYKQMYSRLYKSNYLISKSYENEEKNEPIIDEQYKKYEAIKNHAEVSFRKQSSVRDHLKESYNGYASNHAKEVAEKTQLINILEYEVMMMRKNAELKKANLDELKRERMNRAKTLEDKYHENNKIERDIITLKREHFHIKLHLLDIYRVLNIHDLPTCIVKFKELHKDYNDLSTKFNNLNQDIVEYNNIYTALENEYKIIKDNLAIKRAVQGKNIETLKSYDLQIKTNANHYTFQQLETWLKSKENQFKIIVTYLLHYKKKMAESMGRSAIPHYFRETNSIALYQEFFNPKTHSISEEFGSIFINERFIHFLLAIFKDFSNQLFITLSNCFNIVVYEMINSSVTQTNYEEYDFYSGVFFKSFDQYISYAMEKHDNKLSIQKRREKEALKRNEMRLREKAEKDKEAKSKISDKDLYKKYLSYLSNKQNRCEIEEVSKRIKQSLQIARLKQKDNTNIVLESLYPNHSLSLMNKYTNELVMSNKKNKEKNILMNRKQSAELCNVIGKDKMFKHKESINANDDSYENIQAYDAKNQKPINSNNKFMRSSSSFSNRSKTRTKEFSNASTPMSRPNFEKDLIYNRLNDIQKLEYCYFKTNDKSKNKIEYNEIYYDFKKKYLGKTFHNKTSISFLPKVGSKNKKGTNKFSKPFPKSHSAVNITTHSAA